MRHTQIDLFSGIGGFTLACEWNGIQTEVFCEKDKRCQEFLQRIYPGIPIVPDAEDLLKLCQEFVHIVGSERFLQVTPDVSRAIRRLSENGEMNIENSIKCISGNTTDEENKKYATTMVENAFVVGSIGWSSFVLITNSITAERNAKDTTILLSGKSPSSEDSQMTYNSFAITATMQNRCMENALIKIENPFILTAGVPCQPASRAGKQRGSADNRWLWPTAIALCRYFNPDWVLFENPLGINDVGLDGILADLESLDYEVAPPLIIPACAVNSPQLRNRYWIVANSTSARHQASEPKSLQGNCECDTSKLAENQWGISTPFIWKKKVWRLPDSSFGVVDGIHRSVLTALGNSIVPQIGYEIIKAIVEADND